MKAWFVWADTTYEWGDFVHGETASKAKSMFHGEFHWEMEGWIYMRAIRRPELDDKPINLETMRELGIVDSDEFWYPICRCELCQGKENDKRN